GVGANRSPPIGYVLDGFVEGKVAGELHAENGRTEQITNNAVRCRRITERERRTNHEIISARILAQQCQIGGQIKTERRREPTLSKIANAPREDRRDFAP